MKKDLIEEFINQFSSINTKKSYRQHINKYFKTLNIDPGKYISNGRNYKKDIENYWKTIVDSPPKTRSLRITAIKMFLEEYLEEKVYMEQLPPKFWRKQSRRVKGTQAVTRDKVPKPGELKEILQHANIQGKALFLLLATSGMRVNEALNLTLNDIELDKTPAQINIPGNITKSGDKRTTFMTSEAKDALKAFLKIREKYRSSAVNRSHFGKDEEKDDLRMFPFGYQNAWEMWRRLIKKSGYSKRDKTTDRYEYHIHALRKFFRSRMGNKNGIGVDMTEFLMGHEGYLTKEYRDYPEEELALEYVKGVERLLIFETPADTSDIREQLAEKDEQIRQLERDMDKMNQTMLMLLAKKQTEGK